MNERLVYDRLVIGGVEIKAGFLWGQEIFIKQTDSPCGYGFKRASYYCSTKKN